MNDYLVKALAFDGQVRAYAVSSTQTIAEAQRRQDSWRTASAALGRAMTSQRAPNSLPEPVAIFRRVHKPFDHPA